MRGTPIDGARIRRRAGLPWRLSSGLNLANAYREDRRTREAEALLESVPANYELTLGHDHPYAGTRENLSSLKRAATFDLPAVR